MGNIELIGKEIRESVSCRVAEREDKQVERCTSNSFKAKNPVDGEVSEVNPGGNGALGRESPKCRQKN